MVPLTATALAALRRVHPATARGWIADARRRAADPAADVYATTTVAVLAGHGATLDAHALLVPADVVARWRSEAA